MDQFLASIYMFGGNFAPRGWALCDGQLLAISSNSALFSLLGTTFGGDGRTTFALPDLRGRAAIHPGNGPGLSSRRAGQRGGSEFNVLNTTQLPSHNHGATGTILAKNGDGDDTAAESNFLAIGKTSGGEEVEMYMGKSSVNLGSGSAAITVNNTGKNQSVNNMQPWATVNYIIALEGVYPPRS